jgi:2-phosphosulfolactate phosphatase
MQIETCFSPQAYPLFHNPGSVVVMIDILRASSAITTAFYNGVSKMIPVSAVDEAREYKAKGFLVAAERNAEVVSGFDLGNSPFSYMSAKVKGKTIVITTTNGTHAIHAAKGAHKIIIGSFLNLDKVIEYLVKEKRNVLFLCAGWKNKFNLEDTVFAGAVSEGLVARHGFVTECDSTLAAMELYQSAKHNLYEFLSHSSHRNRLSKLNLERDVKYCLTPNQCPVVPVLNGNTIVKEE